MRMVDKDRIRKVLTETVLALCQTGMEYNVEMCVEGLLGITLDKKDIILVNINEIVRNDMPTDLSTNKRASEKRKHADSDFVNNNTPIQSVHHNQQQFNNNSNSSVPMGYNMNKKQRAGVQSVQSSVYDFSTDGYNGHDQNGGDYSDVPETVGTLRMPIIPPEHIQPTHFKERRKQHINNMTEKHTEISRILGSRQAMQQQQQLKMAAAAQQASKNYVSKMNKPEVLNAASFIKDESRDYISATGGSSSLYNSVDDGDDVCIVDADGNISLSDQHTITTAVAHKQQQQQQQQAAQDFAVAQQQFRAAQMLNSFLLSSAAADIASAQHHKSPAVSTHLPTNIPSPQVSSAMGSPRVPVPPPIGVVVNTNVQPPAPLALLDGSGALQSLHMRSPSHIDIRPSSSLDMRLYSSTSSHDSTRQDGRPTSAAGSLDYSTKSDPETSRSNYASPAKFASPNSVKSESTPSSAGVRGCKEFRRFRCTLCPASSSRKFNLQRHMKSHHPGFDESYILDLTPKERGNQCFKVDGKPQSPGSGEFTTYGNMSSGMGGDELSNTSDVAMDLSGSQNISEDNTSPYDLGSCSSGSISNSPAVTKLDPTQIGIGPTQISGAPSSNNDTFGNQFVFTASNTAITSSSSDLLKTPPTGANSSNKVISRGSGSGRSRKGLDQVLFSKFGCYTDAGNTCKPEPEVKTDSPVSFSPNALASPTGKVNNQSNTTADHMNDLRARLKELSELKQQMGSSELKPQNLDLSESPSQMSNLDNPDFSESPKPMKESLGDVPVSVSSNLDDQDSVSMFPKPVVIMPSFADDDEDENDIVFHPENIDNDDKIIDNDDNDEKKEELNKESKDSDDNGPVVIVNNNKDTSDLDDISNKVKDKTGEVSSDLLVKDSDVIDNKSADVFEENAESNGVVENGLDSEDSHSDQRGVIMEDFDNKETVKPSEERINNMDTMDMNAMLKDNIENSEKEGINIDINNENEKAPVAAISTNEINDNKSTNEINDDISTNEINDNNENLTIVTNDNQINDENYDDVTTNHKLTIATEEDEDTDINDYYEDEHQFEHENEAEQEQDGRSHNEDDNESEPTDLLINDENANEETSVKLKVLRNLRRKSVESPPSGSVKARVGRPPKDAKVMRLRARSRSGGNKSTA